MGNDGVLDYIVPGKGNHRRALEWAEWRALNINKDYKDATQLIVYCGDVEIAVIDIEDVNMSNEICKEIEKQTGRSAWECGVIEYAYELAESLGENEEEPTNEDDLIEKMLNGESDWKQYSWGGSALISDNDIAERLCSHSELKRCANAHGLRQYANAKEQWLDVQTRALHQAASMVVRVAKQIHAL